MLDTLETLALRQGHVGRRHIVLVVDEGLALAFEMPERRDGIGLVVGFRCLCRLLGSTAFGCRLCAGVILFAKAGAERELAVGSTGRGHSLWRISGTKAAFPRARIACR